MLHKHYGSTASAVEVELTMPVPSFTVPHDIEHKLIASIVHTYVGLGVPNVLYHILQALSYQTYCKTYAALVVCEPFDQVVCAAHGSLALSRGMHQRAQC